MDFGLRRKSLDEVRFGEFVKRIAKLIDKPSLVVCWKDVNDDIIVGYLGKTPQLPLFSPKNQGSARKPGAARIRGMSVDADYEKVVVKLVY